MFSSTIVSLLVGRIRQKLLKPIFTKFGGEAAWIVNNTQHVVHSLLPPPSSVPAHHSQGPPFPRSAIPTVGHWGGLGLGLGLRIGLGLGVRVRRTVGMADPGNGGPESGKGGPQVTVEPGPVRALLRHCIWPVKNWVLVCWWWWFVVACYRTETN